MTAKRITAIVATCLLWTATVLAEEPEDELLDEFALLDLQAEVSSAARHPQPLSRSPSAITLLTRQDIESTGARTLPEVLRLVPGMDVYMAKPLWYSLGVRGNTTNAADSLLLLVDGRDVTHEFLGAPLSAIQHFSLDEVERIEIIRGPGSALYGANAYSGVVHVITREPGQGPTASVSVRGGEHGAREVSCSANARLGSLGLGAGVGFQREDLWTGRGLVGQETIRGRLAGKTRLGSATDLLVEAGVFRTAGPLYSDIGTVDVNSIDDYFGRVRLDHEALQFQVVYNRTQVDSELDLNLYYKDLGMVLAEAPPLEAHTEKVIVQGLHSFEGFHNVLVYGAEYIFNGYHSPIFVKDHKYEHRMGVFAQDELNLSSLLAELANADIPDLFLTAGLRFDYNSITDWELSPRAALVFTPDANNSFRFGYAHAFLKPTFLESSLHIRLIDVSNLDFDELNLANSNIANQTIDSLELGYAGAFLDGRLLIRLDLAYNWYRKSIRFHFNRDEMGYKNIAGIRVPDLDNLGMYFGNDTVGEDGHNVELQVIARPTEYLRLFASAAYRLLYGPDTLNPSDSEPVMRLSAGADVRTSGGWSASIQGFFVTKHEHGVEDPDSLLEPSTEIWTPATLLLNVRVAREIDAGSCKFIVGLAGFNLLKDRFSEQAGRLVPNRPDYGAERLDRRIVLFLYGEI
jgi:iron complex outermembrane receptor protein